MGPEMPGLSLSSGPTVSGGGAYYGGNSSTGDFRYYGRQTAADQLAGALPLIVLGGLALWLIMK